MSKKVNSDPIWAPEKFIQKIENVWVSVRTVWDTHTFGVKIGRKMAHAQLIAYFSIKTHANFKQNRSRKYKDIKPETQ